MQTSALLLTMAAAAVANAQAGANSDWAFPDTGPVTTDLTKYGRELSSEAVSDCDHCLAKARQDCPNTQGLPVERMNKECKPSNPLTDEAFKWEPVTAPVEDGPGHRTGMSAGEGSTA